MNTRYSYLGESQEDEPPKQFEKIKRKPKFDDKLNYDKRGDKRKRRRRSPKP